MTEGLGPRKSGVFPFRLIPIRLIPFRPILGLGLGLWLGWVHHAIPTDYVPTDAIPTVHSRDVGQLTSVE